MMKKLLYSFLFFTVFYSTGFSQTWTGNTNSDWNTGSNWSGGVVPTGAVTIPSTTNSPIVSANATCTSITFSGNTATLTVNAGAILSTGALTLNSTNNISTNLSITGSGTLSCSSVNTGTNVAPTQNITTVFRSSISNFNITGNLTIYSSRNGSFLNNSSFNFESGTIDLGGGINTINENGSNISTFSMATGLQMGTLLLSNANPFTITATGTTNITLNGAGATVNYDRLGAQIVRPTTYTNLTLSGTSAKTTTTSVVVNGILSMEGTATASTSLTYGSAATLQYNTTTSRTTSANEWPATFSGAGGVIIKNTGIITLNAAKNIGTTLTISAGSKINLGTFANTANALTLDTNTYSGGVWGATGATGATNFDNNYFSSTTGRITLGCATFTSVSPTTRVIFNTLDKTTSASSTLSYESFITETPTVVSKTQYYALTVQGNTGGTNNTYFTAFIDWNNDGVFNTSDEYFIIGTVNSSNGSDTKVASVYIQIPPGTGSVTGNVKMRIIGRRGGYNTTSCTLSNSIGQMEEYTITIQDACTGNTAPGKTASNANPVCANAPFELSLENQSTISRAATYEWETSIDGGNTWITATPKPKDFFYSDFSTMPSNTNIYGSAYLQNGELFLTPNSASKLGGFIVQSTPGININPFTVNFNYRITGGNGADGFSLSYASNIVDDAGGAEVGEGDGINIQFDTYDNEGVIQGSRVRVLYNGFQLFTTSIDIPFNLLTSGSAKRNVILNVDKNGVLSLTIGGKVFVANLQLPTAYLAANKSTWKFKFSARTGANYDFHVIDDLSIKYLDVTNTSSTFTTAQTVPTNYRAKVTCGGVTNISTPILINMPAAPTVGTINNITCSSSTGSVILNSLPSGSWIITQNSNSTTSNIPGSGTTYTVPNLAAGTYTFTVTSGTCTTAPTADVNITNQSSTTWDGSTWSAGLPDVTKNVIFASAYPITTDMSACACTVNSGVTITIPSGHTLNVKNAVTVLGTGSLIFNNNASLVQDPNTTVNTNTGSITYKRNTTPVRRRDFTYWSAPVSGFTLHDLSPDTDYRMYQSYDPDKGWVSIMNGNGVMDKGVGYIVRAPETNSNSVGSIYPASFVGVPNNGDVNVTPIVPTKWNLVGNPYPSALDATEFIKQNTKNGNNIEGTLYFWTHNSPPAFIDPANPNRYFYTADDYAVFNLSGTVATREAKTDPTPGDPFDNIPTGNIASGQSFFVKALTANPIKFNNTMRFSGADNSKFFKATTSNTTKDRLWLNFKNEEGAFKQILVAYLDGATNSWDNNYDSKIFTTNPYIDFYSIDETRRLAIQGRALPFEDTDQIPLGYRSAIKGDFTIAIDHVEGLFNQQVIFLEDKTTGVIHNLNTANYTFKTEIGTFADRFVLRYTNKTLGTGDFENVEDGILISVKNKTINVLSSKENIKNVTIFDITGKTLYSKNKVSNTELQIQNLTSSNQVLLVKVTLDNDFTTTRKIIFQ